MTTSVHEQTELVDPLLKGELCSWCHQVELRGDPSKQKTPLPADVHLGFRSK